MWSWSTTASDLEQPVTSRTSDGMPPAPDLELKALAELYARHAPDLTRGHHTAVLFAAAASHRALARQRMPGEPIVRTSPDGAVPDQPDTPRGPVAEIITDDMPFVVESLLAGVGRARRRGPPADPPDRRGASQRHRRAPRDPHRGRPRGTAARHARRVLDPLRPRSLRDPAAGAGA